MHASGIGYPCLKKTDRPPLRRFAPLPLPLLTNKHIHIYTEFPHYITYVYGRHIFCCGLRDLYLIESPSSGAGNVSIPSTINEQRRPLEADLRRVYKKFVILFLICCFNCYIATPTKAQYIICLLYTSPSPRD